MIHSLLKTLDRCFNFGEASAHCDIPCKIYDPAVAQINTLTIIRMQDLIAELAAKGDLSIGDQAQLARLVSQKEAHATVVKEEVRTIWGDYFKAPQFEQFPNTNELVHKIMLQASKCKQNVEPETGEELLALVNEFAKSFWVTKGVEVFEAECPYPPAKIVVYPKVG
jgi:nickel superoxide dismutase